MENDKNPGEREEKIPSAELTRLRKLKLMEEVKEDFLKWVKRWSIILGIPITLFGFLGVNISITNFIRDNIDKKLEKPLDEMKLKTAELEITLSKTRESIKKSEEFANRYAEKVEEMGLKTAELELSLRETIKKSEESANRYVKKMDELSEAYYKVKKNSERNIIHIEMLQSTFDEEVKKIKSILENLTSLPGLSQKKIEDFTKFIDETDKDQKVFRENSAYTIKIIFTIQSQLLSTTELIEHVLQRNGFVTEIYLVNLSEIDKLLEKYRKPSDNVIVLSQKENKTKASYVIKLLSTLDGIEINKVSLVDLEVNEEIDVGGGEIIKGHHKIDTLDAIFSVGRTAIIGENDIGIYFP